MPGTVLKPEEQIRFAAAAIGLKYTNKRWEFSLGDGIWHDLGALESDLMELPYVSETTPFLLKVVLTDDDGDMLYKKIQEYMILNESDMRLLNPAQGTEIMAGEEIELEYEFRDMDGNVDTETPAQWECSFVEGEWMPVEDGVLIAPDIAGEMVVRADIPAGLNRTKLEVFRLDVVEMYGKTTVNFGNSEGDESTIGEVLDERLSGKVYGFNEEHGDRIGQFCLYVPKRGIVKDTYIALGNDGVFEYMSGKGFYRVKAVIRLEHHDRTPDVVIEGVEKEVRRIGWKRLKEIEVVTGVEDNFLTVTGTKGLQIVELIVEELTEEEYRLIKEEEGRPKPPPWYERNRDGHKEGYGKSTKKGGRR